MVDKKMGTGTTNDNCSESPNPTTQQCKDSTKQLQRKAQQRSPQTPPIANVWNMDTQQQRRTISLTASTHPSTTSITAAAGPRLGGLRGCAGRHGTSLPKRQQAHSTTTQLGAAAAALAQPVAATAAVVAQPRITDSSEPPHSTTTVVGQLGKGSQDATASESKGKMMMKGNGRGGQDATASENKVVAEKDILTQIAAFGNSSAALAHLKSKPKPRINNTSRPAHASWYPREGMILRRKQRRHEEYDWSASDDE